MSYAPRHHLPLGVAILAVLIGLVGLVYLLGGLLAVLLLSVPGLIAPHIFGAGIVAGIIAFVFGAVLLLIAYGLWHLELWALVLCIVVVGILWLGDVLNGAVLTLGGLVLLLLLVYLVVVHREFT